MTIYAVVFAMLFNFCSLSSGYQNKWWEKWDNYPKVPRISADLVKKIVLAKEKSLFVYSGYEIPEMVCGSLYIPYSLVPPNADGSRLNLSNIPKDSWIFCYCP
jgi:hypothetical protein